MVIGFPRCGNHFLKFLLEKYFNRIGLGTGGLGVKGHPTDFMWIYDHDHGRVLPSFDKVLYLYRVPVSVISSLVYIEKERPAREEHTRDCSYEEVIIVLANLYKEHLKKYLINYPNKVFAIRYEKLLSNERYDEFEIACNYFSTTIDRNKFDNTYKIATKTAVIRNRNNAYYGNYLLSDEYAKYKLNFRKKYVNMINDIIFTTNKLDQFFYKQALIE